MPTACPPGFWRPSVPFWRERKVLLDLRADDQDQTHRLLKDGEVVGCVSTRDRPVQGCRMDYLGCMNYRMTASPDFAAQWFPEGLTLEAAEKTPALVFNRRDELHQRFFEINFGRLPTSMPIHYVPSSERFVEIISAAPGLRHAAGLAKRAVDPFRPDDGSRAGEIRAGKTVLALLECNVRYVGRPHAEPGGRCGKTVNGLKLVWRPLQKVQFGSKSRRAQPGIRRYSRPVPRIS